MCVCSRHRNRRSVADVAAARKMLVCFFSNLHILKLNCTFYGYVRVELRMYLCSWNDRESSSEPMQGGVKAKELETRDM